MFALLLATFVLHCLPPASLLPRHFAYLKFNHHITVAMPGAISGPRTLYDKVFDDHIVNQQDDDTILLYIDRHLYVIAAHTCGELS